MSEREFENYLTLLASLLRLSGTQREAVSSELRDHLQERVAHLMQQGSRARTPCSRRLASLVTRPDWRANFHELRNLKRGGGSCG